MAPLNDADALLADEQVAATLPITFPVFFSAHGRLLETQRASIPLILSGKSVLICSPTATGKTEATCAPLVERFHRRQEPWLILYISPTRALVNDLYERLYVPLSHIGVRIARRTGDHRDTRGEAQVLLTTPESFDSMLCRGVWQDGGGHDLARTVAVVLDEVHLLHGTARGEQVRWLLKRLHLLLDHAVRKKWRKCSDFQVIALSATVPNRASVRRAFLGEAAEIVSVGEGRAIETVVVLGREPTVEEALPAYLLRADEPQKILVFSNSRKRVDTLAEGLRLALQNTAYTVLSHHGSHTRKHREAAEVEMRKGRKVVMVATSTLEIGVDIGDVDLVVLDGPAPDVPALLQRIGRGNRRKNLTRVMPCCGRLVESLIHDAMIDAASKGDLGDGLVGSNFGVAIQQLVSYIFQAKNQERSRAALKRLAEDMIPGCHIDPLLDLLLGEEEILQRREALCLGEKWKEAAVRGQIHSTIESPPSSTIQDEDTGEVLAEGIHFRGGRKLAIDGRHMNVLSWDNWKLKVRRSGDNLPCDAQWGYVTKGWKTGTDQPQVVKRFLSIPEASWPVLDHEGSTYVFHMGGGRLGLVLQLAAMACGQTWAASITPWAALLLGEFRYVKPESLGELEAGDIIPKVEENIGMCEKQLGRPFINRRLPMAMRVEEVVTWLDLPRRLRAIADSTWERPTDPVLKSALILLLEASDRRKP